MAKTVPFSSQLNKEGILARKYAWNSLPFFPLLWTIVSSQFVHNCIYTVTDVATHEDY